MSERNLKPLFCAFCKKRIADHHITYAFDGNIYRLHCTICGHDSYVHCVEAENK